MARCNSFQLVAVIFSIRGSSGVIMWGKFLWTKTNIHSQSRMNLREQKENYQVRYRTKLCEQKAVIRAQYRTHLCEQKANIQVRVENKRGIVKQIYMYSTNKQMHVSAMQIFRQISITSYLSSNLSLCIL
jgi:hypothetical protein